MIELTRVKRDANGNPRYVVHFLDLLREAEQEQIDKETRGKYPGANIDAMYFAAIKKSKSIGGKKYRGNDFGGGIVFSSYNTSDLITQIEELRKRK